MNVVLHGMEEAAGSGTSPPAATPERRDRAHRADPLPDDALALCHSREQAEQVQARLAAWLQPRGLVFNQDKTRIVRLDDGVDFLGFSDRRYRGKLLIKPGKAAVKRIRARLTAEMKALRGHNAQMVLIRLNPVIRGWSAYYRHCVSSEVFDALDDHMWKLTYKWANWTHPHKGKRWIVRKYFGRFVHTRRDRWVFGDRDSGAYLLKFAWTKITRHTLVKGWASPDDPALASYWAARRRRGTPPLDPPRLRLLQRQRGTARSAGNCSCTLTGSHSIPMNGSSGSRPSARRPASRRSPSTRGPGRKVDPPCSALSTATADAACQTAPAVDQHFRRPDPTHALGLLEPVARKAGTAGSEGAAARQRAAATRLEGPFYRLEAEGFECVLADARQVKNLPGRPKRDPSDSRWLAACFERGAVTACFVATPEFRVIRLHTRYRRDLTEERTREKQRTRSCWNQRRSSCPA